MTQVLASGGRMVPVTVIEAGPCRVAQVKTAERDGYAAVQVAFQEIPDRKSNKPLKAHFAKAQLPAFRYLREFRSAIEIQVGATVKADIFTKGERVDVTGVSKGKGFQGVMKRHHFHGGPRRFGSVAHLAAWRDRFWPSSTGLQLRDAQKEGAWRDSLGSLDQSSGGRLDCRGRAAGFGRQDEVPGSNP